jgi:tRNA pseudouridine(38-40) synthase
VKFVGVCEYDGSNFSGFQSQKNALSVQDALQKAIASVGQLTEKINYSGRTDAGVHSLGQVFDFQSKDERSFEQWLRGINSALPDSISVTSLQEAPEDFHSRFHAIKRTYAYIIYTGTTRPIFLKDYVFWEKHSLNFELMRSEASHLIGTHNFSAFRGSKCTANNPVRNIEYIDINKKENFIVITICANAYLYNMVRIIVGTLMDRASGRLQKDMLEILKSEDRTNAGKTAQAQGLFFLGAEYNNLQIAQSIHTHSFLSTLLNSK